MVNREPLLISGMILVPLTVNPSDQLTATGTTICTEITAAKDHRGWGRDTPSSTTLGP
jgi:hypothetical protein